ncbi:hypothetical protein BS47DRAFT_1356999 [Hydnum rufescens UP504]|uniref:Uncharacterized protein n=1 Tax=Hydnum rufescens UP504 TaxID=1448309 RepID=A0A9P6BBK3_9AGAM|nr:hypothetical protein BS47DRAFT_1356999 [Hydnum rufescens UP504]
MTLQDRPRPDLGDIRFPTFHKDVFPWNGYQHASKPIIHVYANHTREGTNRRSGKGFHSPIDLTNSLYDGQSRRLLRERTLIVLPRPTISMGIENLARIVRVATGRRDGHTPQNSQLRIGWGYSVTQSPPRLNKAAKSQYNESGSIRTPTTHRVDATAIFKNARKDEHTPRNGPPDVPISTDSQEMREDDLMKTRSSFAIAQNRYKDRFQVVLPMSFITSLSLWLIESTVILYNATSLNPTRDNHGKQGCRLPQKVALVRDKAYHRQIDYTVDWPNHKTTDTGYNFSMIRARKPCDSTPKLELNEDELVKMFVSVKLELMAKSTRDEGWVVIKYEPEGGIEDNKTNDESWDPQSGVCQYTRTCNPGNPSGYRGPHNLSIPLQPPSNSNLVMNEEEERNHLWESYFHYKMASQSCPQFNPGHTKFSQTYEDVQELTCPRTRAKVLKSPLTLMRETGRPGAAILTNETPEPGHDVVEPRKPNTIDERVTRTEFGSYGVAQAPTQVNLFQGPNAHEARPKQRAGLGSSLELIVRTTPKSSCHRIEDP